MLVAVLYVLARLPVEPYRANVFTHKTLSGSYQVKINTWKKF